MMIFQNTSPTTRLQILIIMYLLTMLITCFLSPYSFASVISDQAIKSSSVAENTNTPLNIQASKSVVMEVTQYSFQSVILVVLVLVVLGLLLFYLMSWSQRNERTSYLGHLYQDTIQDIEYKRLMADIYEKLEAGEFHREVEMDDKWIKDNPRLRRPDDIPYRSGSGIGGTRNPFRDQVGYTTIIDHEKLDPVQEKKFREWQQKEDEWLQKLESEVQRRYKNKLDEAMREAEKRAKSAIDIDLASLHGRGADFVLEFTTVVVIIFAALILGILKVLDTQQIGTLLAAIAGYVLGRSTQRTKNEPTPQTPNSGEQTKEKK